MASDLTKSLEALTPLFDLLSKWQVIMAVSFVYIVLCTAARRLSPKGISSLAYLIASVHMLALSGFSAALSTIICQELIVFFSPLSIFTSLCDAENLIWKSGALGIIQNLNILLKIIEFHHTFWMALAGRHNAVTQFQIYHNVVLLWMCWSQTGPGSSAVQWLPILLNCFVHVFMYLCMFQVYRGGRTPFFSSLPMFQFVQAVLTSLAILAVLTSRLLHDFIDPVQFPRCSGSWTSFFGATVIALCYPLGYMVLHKPATDTWLAERGLGLFFSIGRNLKNEKTD
uniref:Elongation of fatty acids protein n=1 Tax=Spongospora subterranea TaxID=70186 RepID=A0A0H5R7D7_9EUKA|eukprot:CRZ10065.1 hypothetical protein [Spongospora subterranea]